MLTSQTLRGYIAAGLACEHLEVLGDDGTHFEAIVVSKAFEGKRLIQRHQMVYATLGERMRAEIHALSMKTLTPEEFAARNGGTPAAQPAAGGSASRSA